MDLPVSSHHYIVLSRLYAWLEEEAVSYAKGVLLDYGCGGQPYRTLFQSRVTEYIGADVTPAVGTTLDIQIASGQPLPLSSESVDTILSTQALEHVSDIDFYLKECQRLLKPDGVLILTAPMQWRHHEAPIDFWRFTRYGIVACLSRNGFDAKAITPCGGVYALIGQIFLNHLAERGVHSKVVFRVVNRCALWLDKASPDFDDTLIWMCIVRKMQSSSALPRQVSESSRSV
jgi:SAM-dependent methyltransferase